VLEKAHHNKFILNKEKNFTNNYSKSSKKKREKIGNKREGRKIKEKNR
jgi:hypothetical protein